MSVTDDFPTGLGVIPRPAILRRRLAEVTTEASILRRLLKLAEDAVRERNRLVEMPPVPAEPREGEPA